LVSNLATTELLSMTFAQSKQGNIAPNDLAKDIVNKNILLSNNVGSMLDAFKALHATESFDEDELDQVIATILIDNQDAVQKYREGKTQVLGFLLGLIAQTMKKKLDMNAVRGKLLAALTE
jgi:Asp-tRNA(Asn)/Glu-tRNA(Gln) amidotransferase B subunit